MKYRKEFDSIGGINVPSDKYWGASTQRSKKYFNIGDFLVRPMLIKSIAIIKKSAAIVNFKNKDIDKGVLKSFLKLVQPRLETISNLKEKFSYLFERPTTDERLVKISNISNSEKTIPATVEFVDIAGLVQGASEGEGLGNKF